MSYLRILHITDTHFGFTGNGESEIRLFSRNVSEAVKRFHADLCIHTGDVLNRPASEDLYRFYADLRIPCVHIPGNHDDSEMMKKFFPETADGFPYTVEKESFRVIGLDSSSGKLGTGQLRRLESILSENTPSILLIHHQFLPIEDSWLNPYLLEDADSFGGIIKDYQDTILAVFHGHFHCPFFAEVGTIPVFGGPSAAYQFDPSASFKTISSRRGEAALSEIGGAKKYKQERIPLPFVLPIRR